MTMTRDATQSTSGSTESGRDREPRTTDRSPSRTRTLIRIAKTGSGGERAPAPAFLPSSRCVQSDSKITIDRRRTNVCLEPRRISHHNHRQSFLVRDRDSAIHILTDRSEHFPDTLLHPQNTRTIVVVVVVVDRRVSIKIRAGLFPTNTNSQFNGIRDSICEISPPKGKPGRATISRDRCRTEDKLDTDDSTTTQGWKGWKASACKSNDREARAARRDVGKRLTSESRSAPPDARACPLP